MTRDLGAVEVIDADRVTHHLMQPGTELSAAIGREFGVGVLSADGSVNRQKLGEAVFPDRDALTHLESIVHPMVRQSIAERIESLLRSGAKGIVTVEAIRLLDSPIADLAAAIWLVQCSHDVQMTRLIERRDHSPDEAGRRMAAEPRFDLTRVTNVIRNDLTIDDLRARVSSAWAHAFDAPP